MENYVLIDLLVKIENGVLKITLGRNIKRFNEFTIKK
jgi:hypothetical protein